MISENYLELSKFFHTLNKLKLLTINYNIPNIIIRNIIIKNLLNY